MSALLADGRAFGAAALKQWRETRRYPAVFFAWAAWPVIFPAVYVAQAHAFSGGDPRAIDAFASVAGTREITGFLFVGWGMYMWLSIVLWGPGTSLRNEQVRGSLEAVFLTPASRFVVLFGPPAAYLITAAYAFGVMWLALELLFGVSVPPDALAAAAVVILATVPAMYGIGALFASLVIRSGEVNNLVQAARALFTLASGVTYPVALLPVWAQAVAVVLPPTYFVSDLRAVLFGGATLVQLLPDLAMLIALGAFSCALAVLAFRAAERRAQRTGMLGRY